MHRRGMINLNTHLDFLEQKNKIDSLIERGYVIVEVIENLDGSYVTFEKKMQTVKERRFILRMLIAGDTFPH